MLNKGLAGFKVHLSSSGSEYDQSFLYLSIHREAIQESCKPVSRALEQDSLALVFLGAHLLSISIIQCTIVLDLY